MLAVLVLLATLFGCAIGSFLNVVAWRVPRGESVVSPPSACPNCGHAIRPWDNVPVLSWLLLRGRCRDCRAPISPRYPIVEATTGIAFGVTTLLAGLTWRLPALLYLVALALVLAIIDVSHHRLPDQIVLPAYPTTLALLALASANPDGPADWASFTRALLGGVILLGLYFGLVLIYPAGMGLGDVKLAGVLGMYLGWFGWGSLVVGGFGAFLLGGLFGIALMAAGKARRSTAVPFGPWMLAATLLGCGVGTAVWSRYLALL